MYGHRPNPITNIFRMSVDDNYNHFPVILVKSYTESYKQKPDDQHCQLLERNAAS